MSDFVDAVMVRLSTVDGVRQLVFPAGDTGRQRIRALFSHSYDVPSAVVHDLPGVEVVATECQRPLFAGHRRSGSWLQTIPAQSSGDFRVDVPSAAQPHWMDVSAELLVTAQLLVDTGGLTSSQVSELGDFASFDEFRAKVPDLDLDAFLARHGISTVEQLRERFRYVQAGVRFEPAPPPDADSLTTRRFPVSVAVLVRDGVDLASALRDVRLVALAAEREAGVAADDPVARRRAACAPLLVLPADAVGGAGLGQEQITAFFAAQRVLAVFEQT